MDKPYAECHTGVSGISDGMVAQVLLAFLIEKCNLLGKKTLPISAIRGRREYVVSGDGEGGRTRYLRLVSNDDRYPTIDFMKNGYNWDDAFRSWFDSLDDLDARDKEQAHKASNFGPV